MLQEYNIARTSNVAKNAEREVSEAEAARDEASAVKEISEEKSLEILISFLKQNQIMRGIGNQIYRCQHLITTTTQNLLEESCFEFAHQHFPCILAIKGWVYPKTNLISQHPLQPAEGINKPIDEVFGLLYELRYSAAYRLRKTSNGIEQLAENIKLFLKALDDVLRSEKVSVLRRELKGTIEELKRNKDLLEGRLHTQLKDV
ncbi:hypothetical protein N7481_010417 [Penicillium waksmanii]|uniref:uncharacterized protein n=1 Tax=Penicillium waksmanii TaxID=69791 RepID=UPI002548B7E5|nr:uncharacterized protein N7481_010417 [Penicillium waksmanii]KAJ5973207.1 hypothetical protein N7481_010417 [Penicillium waksmanii]